MADPLTTQDVSIYDKDSNPIDVETVLTNKKALLVTLPEDLIIPVELQEDSWSVLVKDGKGFVATSDALTVTGSTETDFMLLKNPASSGKYVRFKEFLFSIDSSTTQGSIVRFYRDPTITANGTSLAANKLKKSQSDTAVATIFKTPTISARGTLLEVFQIGLGVFNRDLMIARFLEENENMLVTVQGTKVNVVHALTVLWAETAVV